MKEKRLKKYILEAFAVVAFQMTGGVVADVKNFGGEIPNEMDIVEALKPQMLVARTKLVPRLKTRGLRPIEPAAQNSSKPAASFGLTFGFNSAELTAAAIARLDKIGGALQRSELSNSMFRIEGYTDSSGDEKYNERLSKERAISARDYLVQNFAIGASRLKIIGKGESNPLNRANPEGAENRRVQIVNLGTI